MTAKHGSPALPRWLAAGIAVLGLLAIGTGMRAPAPRPAPEVGAESPDSTFPPYRGFMMDSLRRGRGLADTLTAQRPHPRKRPAARADSAAPRYSPRSCMPE